VSSLEKDPILAEGMKGEDREVKADVEEEADDESGQVRKGLHKYMLGLKKKLKTLTSPQKGRRTQ
jgi:hypothetical protein